MELQPSHGRYALRFAEVGDLDFLWQLKLSTLRDYITQIFGWDEALARSLLERHWRGSYIVLVGAQQVGQLKVTQDAQGWMFLDEILLTPAHQRRGLGTRIIRDLLRVADSGGYNVDLQVLANNPARRLYERLGFEVTHYKMCRRPPPGVNAQRSTDAASPGT